MDSVDRLPKNCVKCIRKLGGIQRSITTQKFHSPPKNVYDEIPPGPFVLKEDLPARLQVAQPTRALQPSHDPELAHTNENKGKYAFYTCTGWIDCVTGTDYIVGNNLPARTNMYIQLHKPSPVPIEMPSKSHAELPAQRKWWSTRPPPRKHKHQKTKPST